MKHASHGRSVAIICPASTRSGVEDKLSEMDVAWRAASAGELGPGVNLVSPQEAKGLEFDAVVVVEPEEIVAEDPRGHRLLYIALTRTTRYLSIVCFGDPLGPAKEHSSSDLDWVGEALMSSPLWPKNETVEKPDPWGPLLAKLRGSGSPDETEKSSETAEVASGTSAAQSTAPTARGRASERFIQLAAEEVATLLQDTVSPSLWASVLERVRELLSERPEGRL